MTAPPVASPPRGRGAAKGSALFSWLAMLAGLVVAGWGTKSVFVFSSRLQQRFDPPEMLAAALASGVCGLFLVTAGLFLSLRARSGTERLVVLLAIAAGTGWAGGPLADGSPALNAIAGAARSAVVLFALAMLAHAILVWPGGRGVGVLRGARRFLLLLYTPALAISGLIVLEVTLRERAEWSASIGGAVPVLGVVALLPVLAAFARHLARTARAGSEARAADRLVAPAVAIAVAVAVDACLYLLVLPGTESWSDAIAAGRGATLLLVPLVLAWRAGLD